MNQKNTPAVINSFSLVSFQKVRLIISGLKNMEVKDKRITFIGQKISRQEIHDAYAEADCIIAPSTREGLGMCFFEAKKIGCDIITSNVEPMKEHSNYLCRVSGYNQSDSLIPFAVIEPSAIAEQINKYCEDFYGTK
ncbi:MAG: glycosyltransferase [Spirochaetia bacterium]|nr:glycosyltransferase [Spirochaetia bacterium]